MANISTRPIVNSRKRKIEVHLIDVSMNIYGRYIDIVLRKKWRQEQRFSSLEELQQQIGNNIIAAKNFFNSS